MYRILLIDDNIDKKNHVETFLNFVKKDYGNESVSLDYVETPEAGLAAIEPGRYPLILVDHLFENGPETIYGTDIIPKIKEKDPDATVWIYTSSFLDRENALSCGADDLMHTLEPNCYSKFTDFVEEKIRDLSAS